MCTSVYYKVEIRGAIQVIGRRIILKRNCLWFHVSKVGAVVIPYVVDIHLATFVSIPIFEALDFVHNGILNTLNIIVVALKPNSSQVFVF